MNLEACFYLGYIAKAIGNKGELSFKLDVDSPSSYEGIDGVWIQQHPKDEDLIPFFLEHSKLQNNDQLRVKLEGIDDQFEAKEWVGKSLYLPLEALPELKGNQFYFHEITGFTIIDELHGEIGKVEKVLEFSTSNLFSIPVGEKEVLIPISDDTILSVNRTKQEITVRSPEGLIELYLND